VATVTEELTASTESFISAISGDLNKRRAAIRQTNVRLPNGKVISTTMTNITDDGAHLYPPDELDIGQEIVVDFGEGPVRSKVMRKDDEGARISFGRREEAQPQRAPMASKAA